MSSQNQPGQPGQGDQRQQSQQSGNQPGTPNKQAVQNLITQIEGAASQSGSFTCSHDQAMNTVLPALKALNL